MLFKQLLNVQSTVVPKSQCVTLVELYSFGELRMKATTVGYADL
ncbi:MAG: hypothetical protein RM338_10690 [Nostoc sp. DedQUE12a]|nr:hypothetical protein [Nostoc sp. DedQUE12a]